MEEESNPIENYYKFTSTKSVTSHNSLKMFPCPRFSFRWREPLHQGHVLTLRNDLSSNTIQYNTIQYNTYIIDRSPQGLFRANETQRNDRTEQQQLLRIPTGRRQTSWLFTSAAGKLNQGLPGSNSTSGQSGSWTRDLRISRQAP